MMSEVGNILCEVIAEIFWKIIFSLLIADNLTCMLTIN